MIVPTLTIARNTLVESLRQPIFFVVLALSGVAQYLNTAMTAYSMGYRMSAAGEVTGDDKLLLDIGLATVLGAGIILAAFVATAAISREIENKTVLTVVSKPIGRPAVVLGKFLGIAVAMLIGATIMILHFLFALHHGVLSTAADDLHQPVLVFALSGFGLALAVAAMGNFWYGWSFNQTFVLVLLPLTVVGYLAALPFEADWGPSTPAKVLRVQVYVACFGVMLALVVMSAIATAASTRLGQVMTVVVCSGLFMLGLLSNHLVGRFAFVNSAYGVIAKAEPLDFDDEGLARPGQSYRLTLRTAATRQVRPGDAFYYGSTPSGFGLAVPAFVQPEPGSVNLAERSFPAGTPSALLVTRATDTEIVVKHVGATPLGIARAPVVGDWVFPGPTQVRWPALAVWGVIPNVQNFWLIDAVTQASPIPLSHVGLMAVYAVVQIGACLSVAVLLFQGRDVG